MKRILLAVDFSARSASAAKYAAALACRSQADLTVLHVNPACARYAEVNDISLPPAFALEIAWSELRQQEATEKMTDFVSCHLRGIPITSCVRAGDAAKVIVEHAHATKADLIVMSTHGFGGFRRMLLGSITAKCFTMQAAPYLPVHMRSLLQPRSRRSAIYSAQSTSGPKAKP